ncbi:MAG: Fis family transcriptional regulator [Halothiobacillaceae bacterium]|nr:MAG: Fis family transcriptional regulator [Halothiobacillaceae bacterium]
MKGQDVPIVSVVSNEPERFFAEFSEPLKACGQEALRHHTLAQFSAAVLSPREIVIIDFTSLGRETDTLLLPKGRPVLGLFSQDRRASGHASRCTEVMDWPGDRDEFVAKLKRLCRLVATERRLERTLTLKLNLIGESKAFERVMVDIGKYSKCAAPVLILGETGTGKEQIARAIHYQSVDDGKPFVAVNCGALPDNLVENELFGHSRGAYTDAKESQAGLIEQAEGGTLFLDEIEALTHKGQVVLLRFLQDYEYRPLGSQRSRQAHLRLITASNEPLEQLIGDGCFRKDLYYRLNILSLHLPPLRERAEDVVLLAEHFIDKYREDYQQFDKYLDPQTLEWIKRYDWPGNVRELENLILREFLLAESACISITPFKGAIGERRKSGRDRRFRHLFRHNFQDAKGLVVSEFERSYLQHVLEDAKGNVSEAARQAGKERRTFAKLLDKHNFDKKQFSHE